ncbi:MAG: lytic transglycosylase domain-containing protein [Pseudomonadota bacterium]
MLSALEIHGVPIECINQAALVYHVPAKLILSILAIENGRVGIASANKNGTFDYGPMQINSVWLSKIHAYGYTKEQLQYDPCVNVAVGTWILSQNIANADTTWRGIGGYHSHTTNLNFRYQNKVSEVYQLLSHYLSNNTVS